MTDQPPELRPHFQFDIRTLLALTALVAWLLAWAGSEWLPWLIVFVGLAMMEAACYRGLGVLQLLVRNLFVFFFCSLIVGAFAFGLAYGSNPTGWCGTDHFWVFPSRQPMAPWDVPLRHPLDWQLLELPYTFAFCIVIIHRVLDGRARWPAYLLLWLVLGGCLLPLLIAWTAGIEQGWLFQFGFRSGYFDFDGTILAIAWATLAGILVFGRKGHGARGQMSLFSTTCTRWLATFGVGFLLLDWGPVSLLRDSMMYPERSFSDNLSWGTNDLANILIGIIGATIASLAILRRFDFTLILCGGVGAGIAYRCAEMALPPSLSICFLVVHVSIGLVAGGLVVLSSWLLNRLELDDPGAVLATFGVPAIWGAFAVAIYVHSLGGAFSDTTFTKKLSTQFVGVAVSFLWVFPICLGFFLLIRHVPGLRLEEGGIEN